MSDHIVHVQNGKYTFISRFGKIEIKRHGEDWVDEVIGANAVSSMMAELDAARAVLKAAREVVRTGGGDSRISEALALHERLVSDTMSPSDWCTPAKAPESKPHGAEYHWHVNFLWQDSRGQVGSSATTTFPEGMSALDVIIAIATWRKIDLTKCTSIDVTRNGRVEFVASGPVK